MKRLLLSLVLIGAFVSTMAGCHASAEIDPHHSTAITPAR